MKLYEVSEVEEWREIPGWSYEVSSLGRVRNKKGQIVKPWIHKGRGSGRYLRVSLWNGLQKKNFRVNRLVAIAFLPNPDRLPEVDHINQDTFDNRVENLRWVSPKENIANQRRFSERPPKYRNARDVAAGVSR